MPWICGSISLETYKYIHMYARDNIEYTQLQMGKNNIHEIDQLILSLFIGFLAFSIFMTSNRIYPKSKSLSRWFLLQKIMFTHDDDIGSSSIHVLVFTNDLSSIVSCLFHSHLFAWLVPVHSNVDGYGCMYVLFSLSLELSGVCFCV